MELAPTPEEKLKQYGTGTPWPPNRTTILEIISPTIFNIVIDAVIRATETEMRNNKKTTIIFHADDRLTGGYNYKAVQQTLDAFVQNFKAFGLMMNVDKTETMTC
jgi:Reverse transcriptase (RNA-dependent DNA polymerase)